MNTPQSELIFDFEKRTLIRPATFEFGDKISDEKLIARFLPDSRSARSIVSDNYSEKRFAIRNLDEITSFVEELPENYYLYQYQNISDTEILISLQILKPDDFPKKIQSAQNFHASVQDALATLLS